MWLRRAVRLPWNLIGALTVLSITAATLPLQLLTSAFKKPPFRDLKGKKIRKRVMPEVYDAQEVAAMLTMVQAAMQHKSQQLQLEKSASVHIQQQVDGLQESLENMSYLFAQEQQHRLGLQAELQAAESAAADLRQMLSMFFGDTPSSSPDTASETGRGRELNPAGAWSPSSPSQLQSGLPGTLDRRDSRLQVDLAGIQKRLHKIAQLRDTPPSSPRSAERISAWGSPSSTGAASPRSPDLGQSSMFGSRLSPLKLSPLRTTTMSPSHDQRMQDRDGHDRPHARFEHEQRPLSAFAKTANFAGNSRLSSGSLLPTLDDAVSLDSSNETFHKVLPLSD